MLSRSGRKRMGAGPGRHVTMIWWAQGSAHMGISRNGVSPKAGWFIGENPNLKWMICWGNPRFRKPPYSPGILNMISAHVCTLSFLEIHGFSQFCYSQIHSESGGLWTKITRWFRHMGPKLVCTIANYGGSDHTHVWVNYGKLKS